MERIQPVVSVLWLLLYAYCQEMVRQRNQRHVHVKSEKNTKSHDEFWQLLALRTLAKHHRLRDIG